MPKVTGRFCKSINGVPRVWRIARLRLDQGPSSAAAVGVIGEELLADNGSGVLESSGEAQFVIRRLGESPGEASVAYSTRDGTAKAGRDYAAQSGVVESNALEVEKTVSVPILDNATLEGPRAFQLVLGQPVGFEAVSSPATLTIHDDELGFLPGALELGRDSTGLPFERLRWIGALETIFTARRVPTTLRASHTSPYEPEAMGWSNS